jgi:tellurite resistance protein TerC
MDEYVNAAGRLVGIDVNMPHVEVPTTLSLAFIFGVLTLSILLSVVANRRSRT